MTVYVESVFIFVEEVGSFGSLYSFEAEITSTELRSILGSMGFTTRTPCQIGAIGLSEGWRSIFLDFFFDDDLLFLTSPFLAFSAMEDVKERLLPPVGEPLSPPLKVSDEESEQLEMDEQSAV